MTTRLTLVCHASTASLRASAFPLDEPLDAYGLKTLQALKHRLADADRCLTSPAMRAVQTARALHLDAATEPALRECDHGRWAGRTLEKIQSEDPDGVAGWLYDPAAAPHGGESLLNLLDRVGGWLDRQLRSPGRVVAVTHASVIRAAIVHAIEATPRSYRLLDVAPLCSVALSGNNGRWTLVFLGPVAAA